MREQLIIKRQLSGDWHWLVRSADSHVFNRSDTGFHAEDACIADAKAHGFSTEQTLDRDLSDAQTLTAAGPMKRVKARNA